MNNKSSIQIQLESIQARGAFAKELHSILEKYDVQDAVFGLHHSLYEMSTGYFVETGVFENLDEAVREMNDGQALRVVESSKFIVGDVYPSLSDCPESAHVFNIEFLEDVY